MSNPLSQMMGVERQGIAGLSLWLRADSIAQGDGTSIASWTDQSPVANNASAAGTAQPTYKTNILNGLPVVRFNGTTNTFALASAANLALASSTMFIVGCISVAPASLSQYATFFIGGTAANSTRINCRLAGTNWGFWSGSDQASGEDLVSGAYNLLCITRTSGSSLLYRNGTQKLSVAVVPSTGAVNQSSIGNEVGFTRFLNGDIAEILYYSHVLSTAERQQVENYISSRYAIF